MNEFDDHLMWYIYYCNSDCERYVKKQILNYLIILRQLDYNLNNLPNLALRSICRLIPNTGIDNSTCEEDQNVFERQIELEPASSDTSDDELMWFKYDTHPKGIGKCVDLILPEIVKNIKYKFLTSIHEIFMHEDGLAQFTMNGPKHIEEYMTVFSKSSITSVDLSNLNTSDVTSMESMFSGFTHVKHIDVHNIDSSQA